MNAAMVKRIVDELISVSREMNLRQSLRNLEVLELRPPKTDREIAIYYDMVMNELDDQLFLYIPNERGAYWECQTLVSDAVKDGFEGVNEELRAAGSSYACALNTASVFHSMRALEVGLRNVASQLGIDAADEQWKLVIEQIEKKARQLDEVKRHKNKKEDQQHYSEIALHLSLCKDAWRNYVAHAKVTYSQPQALEILRATCRFFEKACLRQGGPDDSSAAPPS